jgi:RNA polymerase subunit RPABC4/transcription elongation factor Spt4
VNRQQRRAARRRASNEGIPIKFGTVGYGPDAPVDAPTHVWMCDCKSCRKLAPEDRMHGPFHTEEEARADCEKVVSKCYGYGRLHTEEATLRLVEEDDDVVLVLEKDHRRIAKRYSGGNWIVLEPGYKVFGSEPGTDYNSITIEFDASEAMQSH